LLSPDARFFPAKKLALCSLWIPPSGDQLAAFSSYSAEWAEKAAREQSTAYRAFKNSTSQLSRRSPLITLAKQGLLGIAQAPTFVSS